MQHMATTRKEPTVPITKLAPNPDNPRVIKDEKFQQLVRSVTEFPKMMEIRKIAYVEQKGKFVVFGGNQRLKAIQAAGITDVPVKWLVDISHLTAAEREEFLIKDNLAFGDWDYDQLQDNFALEQLEMWGLDFPPYKIRNEAEEDNYLIPEDITTVRTNIKPGDLFELESTGMRHLIMCGDSGKPEHMQRLMGTEKGDMEFTDPPYNVNYSGRGKATSVKIKNDNLDQKAFQELLQRAFKCARTYLKDNAGLYVCYASRTHREFEDSLNIAGFEVRNQIIWVKTVASMGWGDYRWKHEPLLYCGSVGGGQDSILRGPQAIYRVDQPAQRPGTASAYQKHAGEGRERRVDRLAYKPRIAVQASHPEAYRTHQQSCAELQPSKRYRCRPVQRFRRYHGHLPPDGAQCAMHGPRAEVGTGHPRPYERTRRRHWDIEA